MGKVERSTFVTVVAWLFIILSGFSTFVAILQNIMIHTMPLPKGPEPPPDAVPTSVFFIFENVHILVLAFFFICLCTLIVSIALLKRKNWARLIFIGLLCLGIVWNMGALVLQHLFMSSMMETIPDMAGDPAHERFEMMMTISRWFAVAFAIGVSLLFGWMIKKLSSVEIRSEFKVSKGYERR